MCASDGIEHVADVIIYATGFQASEFLTPMRVTCRNDVDLHQQWNGDARAYLGMTIPNFPNLFCLYGPNTNVVVNGSIIFFSDAWGVSKVSGWYKNRHGRVAQNWPFSLIEFWERTRNPVVDDYIIN